jgi:hypothetical protein
MAALVLAAILGAAALAFVLLPLIRRAKPVEMERPVSPLEQLRREKEGIYLAIREVEFDHRTGKVSDADHAALVGLYRARAIDLLQRIDALEDASRAAPPLPRCAGCGGAILPVHRFCTRCGAPAPGEPAATKEGA